MTKEECLDAMQYLATGQCSHCWKSDNEDIEMFEGCLNMISQLINEHFDNSPLKLEELEAEMVVWDNLVKQYVLVKNWFNDTKVFYEFGEETPFVFSFEENRFYRKQVEEQSNE